MVSRGNENVKNNSFQVIFPIGQTLGLALLLVMLLWAGVEITARILVFSRAIDPPMLGSTNAEFDYKLSKLESYIKNHGKVDCIFLGSSQFDDGADPLEFSRRYEQLSGRKTNCFNFSVATLTASPAAEIAGILVSRFHPRVIIYGTSARDYSTNFGEMARPLFDDPWVRLRHGDYSIRGWLIENSYAFRLLAVLHRSADTDYYTFMQQTLKRIRSDGYLPLKANDLSLEDKIYVEEYIKSAEDMRGLDQLIAMNSSDTRIILVEVPVHNSFMPRYVGKGEKDYRDLFLIPIADHVRGGGVQFWEAQGEMVRLIPESGWGDVKHLNTDGSTIYSGWMAEQMDNAVRTGLIPDPFLGEGN